MDNVSNTYDLKRRGFLLGQITEGGEMDSMPTTQAIKQAWKQHQAVMLSGLLQHDLSAYQACIKDAHALMEATLNGVELSESMAASGCMQRLGSELVLLASSLEEHDEQAIEKLFFDVEKEGELIAEDIWCKASWLSFHDEDASLRFRFSWGMEGFEDVAADPDKQAWAAELCTRMFPESELLTRNEKVADILQAILGHPASFVERIVYFNAPNGGAQFHHDVERGHAGVVFAQLSGATFWLAASKPELMQAMVDFSKKHTVPDALQKLLNDQSALSDYMEQQDHELVEDLIDRQPAFIHYMIEKGFSHTLQAGDVLLLPQQDLAHCVWHSVFCLGDEPGEALSFAIR